MTKTNRINIQNETQLPIVVDVLMDMLGRGSKVVLLYGDLGAGKTTLVKYVAKKLGCFDKTSSPTYSLVNEYQVKKEIMYHIDLYRINDTAEAIDMGIEEYISSNNLCFVEWPQVIEPLIDEYIKLNIEASEGDERIFTLEMID